jgi:probable phosphoglycerate mutase
MTEIQERALAVIDRISAEGRGVKTALVSHADVIKPVIAHYLGMDLDTMHRLAVANASVTVLDLGYPGAPRIRYMNMMPWKWKKGLPDQIVPE